MKTLFAALVVLLIMQACTSNEIGNSKDVNPDAIYRSYEIRYTEGDENVSCMCQFRFGGKNGTTLVLNNPSGIALDGEQLKADSGNLTGAYYATSKPLNAFAGEHTLVYTDNNGNSFPQKFVFTPFTLSTKIPAEITAEDLTVSFTGLRNGDLIRVEVQDTSSTTADIYETDTVVNNSIILKGGALAALTNGPLDMGFYADNSYPLDHPSKEGGVLNLFYKLRYQRAVLKK